MMHFSNNINAGVKPKNLRLAKAVNKVSENVNEKSKPKTLKLDSRCHIIQK
jgi:hypothetical protein